MINRRYASRVLLFLIIKHGYTLYDFSILFEDALESMACLAARLDRLDLDSPFSAPTLRIYILSIGYLDPGSIGYSFFVSEKREHWMDTAVGINVFWWSIRCHSSGRLWSGCFDQFGTATCLWEKRPLAIFILGFGSFLHGGIACDIQ